MNALINKHQGIRSAIALAWAGTITSLMALPPWGTPHMQPGIAAVTCAAPAQNLAWAPLPQTASYSFGMMDLRTPPGGTYSTNGYTGTLWNAPCYHDPSWNVKDLGNVYGIALKPDGEIYLGAHGLYSAAALSVHSRYGDIGGGANNLNAAGTIYRIDQTTGVPSVFAVIPGQQNMGLNNGQISGPGLGNLKYDSTNNQFFVTSLEDGKIYRVSGSGTVLNSHDPFTADSGAPGMPPQSERIWGIAVRNNKVYYSTWNFNKVPADQNQIRKVDLNGSGDFIPGSDALVLTLPPSDGTWSLHSNAVSDLSFSADGSILLAAERTMQSDNMSYNHQSRVHRILTATWTINSSLKTGNNTGFNGGECYGGVTWGQELGVDEQIVWMTSADMAESVWGGNSLGPHGVFGVRPADFPPPGPSAFVPNAFKIPFIPGMTADGPDNKGSGGDIEIMQQSKDCEVKVKAIQCPDEPGAPYTVTLTVSNYSPKAAAYASLRPCPAAELPPGASTLQPALPFHTFTPAIPTGGTATITITLPAPATGGKYCFIITLLDATGNDCCTEKPCVDLPRCDCADIVSKKIDCVKQADGTYKYLVTMTVVNQTSASASPYAFQNVLIIPATTLTPSLNPLNVTAVTLTPTPIPPGGTGTVTFCYTGPAGAAYANVVFHDGRFEQCCSIENECFDFPPCDVSPKPDECRVTDHVACKQVAGSTVPMATVTYTICNNGLVPKTYNWFATGVSPSICPVTLTAASFVPASGTVGPVAPGTCATVTVNIRCEGFGPGDCAEFRIYAREEGPAAPGLPICCQGTIYRPGPAGLAATLTGVPTVTAGAWTPLTLEVTGATTAPTPLHFGDSEGLLLFSTDASGAAASSSIAVPVSVTAGTPATVRVFASLNPASGYVPRFTDLLVSVRTGELQSNLLAAPVLLTSADAAAAPLIRNLRFLQAQSTVTLEVATRSGKRYKVQQTASLTNGPWVDGECSGTGVTILPDGSFLGSGGVLSVSLPCDQSNTRMFYRVVQLD